MKPSRLSRALVAGSYAVLGAILCWSRLVLLGQPLWSDEIQSLTRYIRSGPEEILAGTYIANDHEFFEIAAWATTSLVGESEIALRLWSVLPFVVGVAIVTVWLHRCLGAVSGLLYLFLATASPLLLDLSRQARGYGLAYLALSVVVVAALEADRTSRTWTIVFFCAAGVIGVWTLPHFAIAFFTTGAVLLARPLLRVRVAAGLGLSAFAVVAWYAPHLVDVVTTPRQDYGAAIETRWLLTAPIDQTLVPAVWLADDAFQRPNLASLVLVLVFAIVISSSPLLRRWVPALVLCSGVVTTVLTMWLVDAQVVPRFSSFLLVPLFVLLASGAAAAVSRLPRRPGIRPVIAAALLALVGVEFASLAPRVARTPRDSVGAVASAIRAQAPDSTPVFAYMAYPVDLVFHLGRPVIRVRTPAAAIAVCRARRPVFLVQHRLSVDPIELPCANRLGVVYTRFDQYARGKRVDLWLIPPARRAG